MRIFSATARCFLLASLALTTVTAQAADAPRTAIADFSLPSLDGGKVKLSELKGQVVLISFWATWCGPCKQEMPFLDQFASKFADQGLKVLAISTDAPKSQADVRRIVKSKGWKLPILLDAEGAVAGKLNPQNAMPFALYVDRQGRLTHTHEGFQPGDEAAVEARLVALLAEPAPGKTPPK